MDCEEIRELLPLYAGGDLEGEEREAVEAHVNVCAACARELDLFREARAALTGLSDEDVPPPGGWKSIWGGVRQGLFFHLSPSRFFRPETALRGAAVFMFGVALGGLIYLSAVRPTAPVPAVAEAPSAAPGPVALPAREAVARPVGTFPAEVRPAPPFRGSVESFHLPHVEAIPAVGEKGF